MPIPLHQHCASSILCSSLSKSLEETSVFGFQHEGQVIAVSTRHAFLKTPKDISGLRAIQIQFLLKDDVVFRELRGRHNFIYIW